jgi:hypothetical protein
MMMMVMVVVTMVMMVKVVMVMMVVAMVMMVVAMVMMDPNDGLQYIWISTYLSIYIYIFTIEFFGDKDRSAI